jgi:hypothetical protein
MDEPRNRAAIGILLLVVLGSVALAVVAGYVCLVSSILSAS